MKDFEAAFANNPQPVPPVVLKTACVLGTDNTPTETQKIAEGGVEGALLNRLAFIPRASVTSFDIIAYLFSSMDNGVNKVLIDSATIPIQTMNTNTAPKAAVMAFSKDDPARLAPGESWWVGISTAFSAGICVDRRYSSLAQSV